MTDETPPLRVALLALPEASASTVYGMFDLFASVGRDWSLLTTGRPGRAAMQPTVVAREVGGFTTLNGIHVRPDRGLEDGFAPDLVCIPDLFIAPGEAIAGRHEPELAWLRRCHGAGATIAAACSGALLLAESGLLDGCEATTHWAYCDTLRQRYPAVTVRDNRVLVPAGEGQRLLTAGGGTSWQDMALYLVASHFGAEEAMRQARIHLMDWHAQGQLPYATLAQHRQVADRRIAQAQAWLADHYTAPHAVAAMAAQSGLAERSFKRRFRQATGMAPIDYVHILRLEEAKQMLEVTDLPVESVALEIGYEDASFFRRLFRRKVGLTPSEYRRRFGAMRRAFTAAGEGRRSGLHGKGDAVIDGILAHPGR